MNQNVHKGSILGPLLFSIFVNDIPTALSKSKVMMYSDDTTVYYSSFNAERVQQVLREDLGQLSSWITQNGLRMNVRKTQFMSLSRRCREMEADDIKVFVNDEVLKKCDEAKFLVVIVDKQLNRKSHMEKVRKNSFCFGHSGLLFCSME